MDDLETQLKASSAARFKLIATDGVFSMDGYIAKREYILDGYSVDFLYCDK